MELLRGAATSLKERLLALRERAVDPTVHVSAVADGFLTPTEFVAAGDALVAAHPGWVWSGGDPGCQKAYLPASKQLLVCAGVPCARRARGGANSGGGGGGTRAGDEGCGEAVLLSGAAFNALDPAGDYGAPPSLDPGATSGGSASGGLRRYTLHVAYDAYWRTPSLYLTAVCAASGRALTPGELFEDVDLACVQDTATQARLPHADSGAACLRVHPCKHAPAMAGLLDAALGGGEGDEPAAGAAPPPDPAALVRAYLPLFLRMLGSMIPTVEYDTTVTGG